MFKKFGKKVCAHFRPLILYVPSNLPGRCAGFWQNGYFADFFEPPDIFSPILLPNSFSSILWEKVPRKILQDNPRQNPPKIIQQNSPTIFCRGATPKSIIKSLRVCSIFFELSVANGLSSVCYQKRLFVHNSVCSQFSESVCRNFG